MASAPATLAFFLMPPNQPLQLMFKLQKALCYRDSTRTTDRKGKWEEVSVTGAGV